MTTFHDIVRKNIKVLFETLDPETIPLIQFDHEKVAEWGAFTRKKILEWCERQNCDVDWLDKEFGKMPFIGKLRYLAKHGVSTDHVTTIGKRWGGLFLMSKGKFRTCDHPLELLESIIIDVFLDQT